MKQPYFSDTDPYYNDRTVTDDLGGVVQYNPHKKCWVLPGGKIVKSELIAARYARRISMLERSNAIRIEAEKKAAQAERVEPDACFRRTPTGFILL